MRRWTYLICSAFMLGTITTVAAGDKVEPYPACSTKPSDADRKAAQGAFTAGQGSFNEADYRTAITYWRDAFKRDCTAHLLLLNLARAYELAGDKREAVNALKTYVERNPTAADRPQIQRRIDNLEAQLGTGPVPLPVPQDAGAAPLPTAPAADAGAVVPLPTATGTSEPQPPAKPEAKGGKSIVPWIVVGAGGVLTIVGGLVWMGGSSKVKDAEAVCGSSRSCGTAGQQLTPEQQAAIDNGNKGRGQVTTGGILLGVGLVAVAGGLVWHFVLDKPSAPKSAAVPRLGPDFGPGYSGLSLQGQF
jgi:tetratricopeptide (TPR) repeat protein